MKRDKGELVLISSRWGTRFGGIDALNSELCRAIAALGLPVACIVGAAEPNEVAKAAADGIRLVVVPNVNKPDRLDFEAIRRVAPGVRAWIGHDVITGPAANLMRSDTAPSVVLHHMEYEDYAGTRHPNSTVLERGRAQRDVLRGADAVVAVGPRLRESAERMIGTGKVFEIVPGFPDRALRERGLRKSFRVLMTGRLGADDDPVKQARALVAGFAEAVTSRGDTNWRLRLVGLPSEAVEASETEGILRGLLPADRWSNALFETFTEDREALFDHIDAADVFVMPSLREGFGLAAWEAIGLGLPTVISGSSGAYEVLQNAHLQELVQHLEIRGVASSAVTGMPNQKDVAAIKEALLFASGHRDAVTTKAAHLAKRARELFKWSAAARAILNAAGVPDNASNAPHVGRDGFPLSEDNQFLGRDRDLAELDEAWSRGGVHVVHGLAGMGKSELARRWLMRCQQRPDAPLSTCVLSLSGQQGDEAAAVTLVLRRVAAEFGLSVRPDEPADALQGRIAERLATSRCLLVIDGFEVLQDRARTEHPIKALPVLNLLAALSSSPSLVLITSRNPLALRDEAAVREEGRYSAQPLSGIERRDGAVLLRRWGMTGADEALGDLSEKLAGHPLSLLIAALTAARARVPAERFLSTLDARSSGIPKLASERFRAMLDWYEETVESQSPLLLAVLHGLGLMDGAVTEFELSEALAVFHPPAAEHLPELISDLASERLVIALGDGLTGERLLDCHPMIRAHFAASFDARDTALFAAAHWRMHEVASNRVREPLRGVGQRMLDERETREAFRAVRHAALARQPEKAFNTWVRLFHAGILGLQPMTPDYGADLAAIALVLGAGRGRGSTQTWKLLNNRAFAERGLGMIGEAAISLRQAAKLASADGHSTQAMLMLGNVADMLAAHGDYAGASTAIAEARSLVDLPSTVVSDWLLIAPVEMKLAHDLGLDTVAEELSATFLSEANSPGRLTPLGWFRVANRLIDLGRSSEAAAVRDLINSSRSFGDQPVHALIVPMLDLRLDDHPQSALVQELLGLAQRIGDAERRCFIHIVAAEREASSAPEVAREHAREAFALARKVRLRPLELEAEFRLALAEPKGPSRDALAQLAKRAKTLSYERLFRLIRAHVSEGFDLVVDDDT